MSSKTKKALKKVGQVMVSAGTAGLLALLAGNHFYQTPQMVYPSAERVGYNNRMVDAYYPQYPASDYAEPFINSKNLGAGKKKTTKKKTTKKK